MDDSTAIGSRFDQFVRDALARGRAGNKYDDLREFLCRWLNCPLDDVNAAYCNPVSREFSARRGQAVSRARHTGLLLVEGEGEVAAAEARLRRSIAEGAWDGAGVVAAPDGDGAWRIRSVVEHPQRHSPFPEIVRVFPDATRLSVSASASWPEPSSVPAQMPTEEAWTLSHPDLSTWESVLETRVIRLKDDRAAEALLGWNRGDVLAYYVEDEGFVGLLRVESLEESATSDEVEVSVAPYSEEYCPFSEPLRVDFDLPRYSTSFRIGRGDLSMGKLDPLQLEHLKSVAQGSGSMTDRLLRAWFVLQKTESNYRDVAGKGYHFPSHIPNGKRVAVGDILVCRSEGSMADIRVFGIGRLGDVIAHEDGTRSGIYDRYSSVTPPLSLEELGGDPRNSQQNSIQPFPLPLLQPVLERAGVSSPGDLPVVDFAGAVADELGRRLHRTSPKTTFDDLTLTHVHGVIDQSELVLPRHVIARCVAALRGGKHLLLTGPPGTGKTTLAQQLAEAAALLGLTTTATLSTATADWTSADTVGGYWLNRDGQLDFRPGHILRAIEAGSWLIIDELNRADIDKALGQMFTVMSGQAVVLPYTEVRGTDESPVSIVPFGDDAPPHTHPYQVGPTWRILATLNTRDRDLLFSLSHALLRRFAIVDVDNPPSDDYRRLLREQAPTGVRELDERIATLVTMPHRSLGPAILLDVAKYVRSRLHLETGSVPAEVYDEVLREALYAFVLPQLDDLRVDQLRSIVDHVHRRTMLGSDLDASLALFTSGLQLPTEQLKPDTSNERTDEEA